jgi:hypothetical protein
MSAKARSSLSTLNTYAALVWLLNGLHSRPPADQAGRCVAKLALPLTNDLRDRQRIIYGMNESGDKEVPFCPTGMMFFRQMTFPPQSDCPRIWHNPDRQLLAHIFEYIFGKSVQMLQ